MTTPAHIPPKDLPPYALIRANFCEARQQQLRTQGKITYAAIQRIERSRKYAHSPILAKARA